MGILKFSGVAKTYGGLRPLRVRVFDVERGQVVALAGFDQITAEVFVNLATGAMLPEEGTITAFGRATSDIADSADWLSTVDHFGIISERVVLLEQFTPLQNIAMSLTLDVEPMADEIRRRAEDLARETGLGDGFDRPVAGGDVALRHRVRLARALAASPKVLLVEHPLAGLAPAEVAPLAGDIARVAALRNIAVVVLGADPATVKPFADRVLSLNGATGELTEEKTGIWGRVTKAWTRG